MSPNTLSDLRRHLQGRRRQTLSILERLVRINSYTWNRRGIARNADVIRELFEQLGFQGQDVASQDPRQGAHLVLRRDGESERRVVILSHLDTVYSEEDEARHDFRWRVDGKRIYGPGVVDIKGGTLLAFEALSALAAVAPRAFESIGWTVLLNAAEETGSACFPRLLETELNEGCLACLVYEHGTDLGGRASAVTEARRGSARFRALVRGRAAHSGSGHTRGASAIHQLALTVAEIEALSDPDRGLTLTTGVISGGSAINTVPERAEALIDMRADDPSVYQTARAAIHALAGPGRVRARSDGFATVVAIEDLPGYPPWPVNARSQKLADRLQRIARGLGLEVETESRLGASDGCHTWARVPTLDGLGPLGGNIHCPVHDPEAGKGQEFLHLPSLSDRTLLSAALFHDLAAQEPQR